MEQIMGSKDVSSQVVIQKACETEVFVNDNLEISIKQTDSDGDSVVVWFNAIHAQAVIDAIQRAANELAEFAAYEDQA